MVQDGEQHGKGQQDGAAQNKTLYAKGMTMKKRISSLLLALGMATVGGLAHAGDVAIVLNSGDGSVSLIDTTTYKVVGKHDTCKEPHHLMTTLDDKSVIVACAISNELVFFDPKTGKEQKRIKDISDPYHLGFSPDGKWFVSNSLRLDRVDIYDAKDFSLKVRIPAPKAPSHMVFDNKSEYVFITLQDTNEVMAINLKTMKEEWKVPVGPTPAGIMMTPDNKQLLVAIMGANYFEVIDWKAKKSVKKVETDTSTHNFHPKGDGRHYFISNRAVSGGSISVLDVQDMKIVDKYDVPGGPDDMEIRADGKELWTTARFARKVRVIDLTTKKIKESISVGNSPHGVFFLNHAPRK